MGVHYKFVIQVSQTQFWRLSVSSIDLVDLWPRDVVFLQTFIACGSTDSLEGVTQPHDAANHGFHGAAAGCPLLQNRSLWGQFGSVLPTDSLGFKDSDKSV